MTESEKMRCPKCGAEMNHHADKLIQSGPPESEEADGVLYEAHTCPQCGSNALRRAGQSQD